MASVGPGLVFAALDGAGLHGDRRAADMHRVSGGRAPGLRPDAVDGDGTHRDR